MLRRSLGGVDSAATNRNGTLGNVSKLTGWVRADCQSVINTNDVINATLWLYTPYHNPTFGPPKEEWVETGITSGHFSGSATGANLDFYWARGYQVAGSIVNYYNEYLTSDYNQAAYGVNYTTSIQWGGSSQGWRIIHGIDVGGGTSNLGPGANMALAAGAEDNGVSEGNKGGVSHITYVRSGATNNGLGILVISPDAYSWSSPSSQEINWSTPHSVNSACH